MGLLLVALVLLALAALLILTPGTPPAGAAKPDAPALSPGLTPRGFERHCADLLAASGWRVALGRGSADQGVDVLARKGGRSLVVQCKLYTRPVGNKAVQEALAGRGYIGADAAAVVSNASYTPAAHALAARVGVMLLHVSDLSYIDATQPRRSVASKISFAPSENTGRRRQAHRYRNLYAAIAAPLIAGLILVFPNSLSDASMQLSQNNIPIVLFSRHPCALDRGDGQNQQCQSAMRKRRH